MANFGHYHGTKVQRSACVSSRKRNALQGQVRLKVKGVSINLAVTCVISAESAGSAQMPDPDLATESNSICSQILGMVCCPYALPSNCGDLLLATWMEHHFMDDIQTRQYRFPKVTLGVKWETSANMCSESCTNIPAYRLIIDHFMF
jgi:hypothetical protein